MESKTITITLLGVVLFIFILYFITRSSIYPSDRTIKVELNNIIKYVQENKWNNAEESVNILMKAWDRAKYLLAVNYAEEDYSIFVENLAGIQGGVKAKDYGETVNQALSCLKLMENFTKIIPQP